MTAKHPADVQPSHQGHSIGRWDGETLVIDTIAFTPDPSGLCTNDHRPDLDFSQDTPGCDKAVADRYKASLPK
jgi:hypothetical protein